MWEMAQRQNDVLYIDGYTEDEVVYIWSGDDDAVKKYKDITMAQFDLTDIEHGHRRTADNHGTSSSSSIF